MLEYFGITMEFLPKLRNFAPNALFTFFGVTLEIRTFFGVILEYFGITNELFHYFVLISFRSYGGNPKPRLVQSHVQIV